MRFEGSERTVIDGPFTEAKELVAGFWIWECASRDEAIEWLKRAPFDGGAEIELRQIFEPRTSARAHARAARGEARLREQTGRTSVAASATHRAIDAVWRIESARLIAGLTRIVRDVVGGRGPGPGRARRRARAVAASRASRTTRAPG